MQWARVVGCTRRSPIPTSVPDSGKHSNPSRLSCLGFETALQPQLYSHSAKSLVDGTVIPPPNHHRRSLLAPYRGIVEGSRRGLCRVYSSRQLLHHLLRYHSLIATQSSHPPNDDHNLHIYRCIRCRRQRVDWDLFRLHSLSVSKFSCSQNFYRLRKEKSTLAPPLQQLLL